MTFSDLRRTFLCLAVLFVVVCIPIQTLAAKEQFVAVVITGDLARYREAHEAFAKILRAGGMGEDKVKIYVQTPNPDAMSWANSIRKAVGVGADLIITYGAPVTISAKKESKGIPVLFADVYDPVALGIVKDLAVTGGDISGISSHTPIETLLKTFDDIRKPRAIGALYSGNESGALLQVKKLEELGARQGFAVVRAEAKNREDVSSAISAMVGKVDGLYLSESVFLAQHAKEIIDIASRNDIPVISQVPGCGEIGALLTLEADPVEQGQLLAVHAIQVLNGQKAFTLPVRTPKKVSMVINMQAAEKINIKIPFQALGMATRVIK